MEFHKLCHLCFIFGTNGGNHRPVFAVGRCGTCVPPLKSVSQRRQQVHVFVADRQGLFVVVIGVTGGVKGEVQLTLAVPVGAGIDCSLQVTLDGLQPLNIAIVMVANETAGQKGLYKCSDFIDVTNEVGIDGPDTGATVGNERDDPFSLQLLQGFTDWNSAG